MVNDYRDTFPSLQPPLDRCALFLDVDGSLLDPSPSSSELEATPEVLELLSVAARQLAGAVALLSERSISDLDRIFFPLRLPCAGIHGAERRSADGTVTAIAGDREFLDLARTVIEGSVRRHAGLVLEDRGLALALHTGCCPDFHDEATIMMNWLAGASGDTFSVQSGKHVVEIKPQAANKGVALASFLGEMPFRGRRPVVTGDDASDAHSFRIAIERDGISIAIGANAPSGMFRLSNPRHCVEWLSHVVKRVPISA
jgi:trehalose 6-phosphate phosphatase